MTRRPTPLLPSTTSLARRTERVVMTNVLVGLIFVVHLAVGAAAFEITLTGRRWRLPVPLAATQNYLDIEVQALPVLLSPMYFQY